MTEESPDYLPPASKPGKITKADKAAPKNKGGRPRKAVDLSSPEAQAAIAEAGKKMLEDSMPTILAQIAQVRGVGNVKDLPEDDTSLAKKIAIAIADVADAGSNRKRMTPEELERRAQARTRLMKCLVKAQTGGEIPIYRVIAKTFLTDHVVEPFETDPVTKAASPTEVDWTGVPNEALLPINDVAQEIFQAFIESIGGPTEISSQYGVQPELDNRDYGVTPGGLVVRGMSAAQRRNVGTLEDGSTTDVRGIKNQNDPRAKHVNVLGTIAPAAAQGNFQPKFQGELGRHI